jgi:hypothetical protein
MTTPGLYTNKLFIQPENTLQDATLLTTDSNGVVQFVNVSSNISIMKIVQSNNDVTLEFPNRVAFADATSTYMSFSNGQMQLNNALVLSDGSTLQSSTIGSTQIPDGSITQSKLHVNSVGSNQIIDANVIFGKLAVDSVGSNQLINSNVTLSKMANTSIGTNQLIDGSVTLGKLATDSVASNQLIDSNVTIQKMALNSVGSIQLVNSNVTLSKMATSSVGNPQLVDGSVSFSKMAVSNVGSNQIIDGSVSFSKMTASAVGDAIVTMCNINFGSTTGTPIPVTRLPPVPMTSAHTVTATGTGLTDGVYNFFANGSSFYTGSESWRVFDYNDGSYFRTGANYSGTYYIGGFVYPYYIEGGGSGSVGGNTVQLDMPAFFRISSIVSISALSRTAEFYFLGYDGTAWVLLGFAPYTSAQVTTVTTVSKTVNKVMIVCTRASDSTAYFGEMKIYTDQIGATINAPDVSLTYYNTFSIKNNKDTQTYVQCGTSNITVNFPLTANSNCSVAGILSASNAAFSNVQLPTACVGSNQVVDGSITTQKLSIDATLNPTECNTIDVGSDTLRFKVGYFSNLDCTSISLNGSVMNNSWSNTESNIFFGTNGGSVGVGTSNPSYKVHVIGDVFSSGSVIALSDARQKTDLERIETALDKVMSVHGYTYKRIDQPDGPRYAGVIAQEMKEVLPEIVCTDQFGNHSVAYGNISALLIEAIHELKSSIDTMKSDIDHMKHILYLQ